MSCLGVPMKRGAGYQLPCSGDWLCLIGWLLETATLPM
jgi:hypothetical protein